MKATYRISVLLMSMLFTVSVFSAKAVSPMLFSIHVVFSARSYWDGPTKSCIPREKGGCCHIWKDGMIPGPGEISGEMVLLKDRSIQFTVSRGKGMTNETYLKYFSGGRFALDGPITFDPSVLSGLGVDLNYEVPPGNYPYSANGDLVTITFK
jgi:hypothetical protein